ncbi:helix-turn-helix domain-containing protein [Aphanothece microscopica]|uniref:helix-turn-helix domain-containing protein n=1 Tax=Aphanothece microscopica TaxID=1049561 RepID=UPI003CE50773
MAPAADRSPGKGGGVNVGERFAWIRAVIAAQPRPSLAEAAVAVVLAEHYNAERGAAWPAQKTMAELLGRSRRTIREALASLEGRGLIALVRHGGPQQSAAYALVMPSAGAPSRHQRADRPAISGRPVPPSAGGPSRPEQYSRNDSVGNTYPAANARSPYGSRASGGTKNSNRRQRKTALITL